MNIFFWHALRQAQCSTFRSIFTKQSLCIFWHALRQAQCSTFRQAQCSTFRSIFTKQSLCISSTHPRLMAVFPSPLLRVQRSIPYETEGRRVRSELFFSQACVRLYYNRDYSVF